MSKENDIIYVQALYAFAGKNNDELCFKKGDIIIVTQKEEGGWWEGTLNDNTGWFPSNYVTEYSAIDPDNFPYPVMESPPLSPQQSQQQVTYRAMVSKELIESEQAHVAELQMIYSKYLNRLQSSGILLESECKQLTGCGSLEEVISVHNKLLTVIEEQMELPPKEQKIGGAFLRLAPTLSAAHKAYIANHPKAVCVIEKYKDELNSFMECQGAPRPGTLVLTTALSLPFRRLDKYPNVLLEFQRHMEECHQDRGDTQRSIHVLKELTTICSSIRRQKQLELEVVTNKIHGWDGGESLGVFGEVVLMRSVALLPDHRDRYLVLFPSRLIVLALSPRASSFVFEGNYPLNTMTVSKLDDGIQYKNAFEITTGHSKETKVTAVCQSVADQQQWVDSIQQCIREAKSAFPAQQQTYSNSNPPATTPHAHPWSMSCLRPSPPLRPAMQLKDDKRISNKAKKKEENWNEDDALILKVIELYCAGAKPRYTVDSNVDSPPKIIPPENEIINFNKLNGKCDEEEEAPTNKSMMDVVCALKDQISSMSNDYQQLRCEFEKEKQLTHSLKTVIDQYIPMQQDFK